MGVGRKWVACVSFQYNKRNNKDDDGCSIQGLYTCQQFYFEDPTIIPIISIFYFSNRWGDCSWEYLKQNKNIAQVCTGNRPRIPSQAAWPKRVCSLPTPTLHQECGMLFSTDVSAAHTFRTGRKEVEWCFPGSLPAVIIKPGLPAARWSPAPQDCTNDLLVSASMKMYRSYWAGLCFRAAVRAASLESGELSQPRWFPSQQTSLALLSVWSGRPLHLLLHSPLQALPSGNPQ